VISLRTPDQRFTNLPDFPWEPHYLEVPDLTHGQTLRMAYVEAGPSDAPAVLMLHGEPSWSFLWRKVMHVVSAFGLRAIAPDLIGFGRSDKPEAREDYTYARHVGWVHSLVSQLELSDITLVCQDWGGLIGLRLATEQPDRFARIVAANTFLPTGDRPLGPAFEAWKAFSQSVPELPISKIVASGCARAPHADVLAAYDAPFPDERYKAGARQFPMLVPSSPHDPASPANRRAYQALGQWDKPFLTAFGDSDPITKGAERVLQEHVPGARGRGHPTIAGGGHFLQEDRGEELGDVVVDFYRATR
jgi:haloalkane dehalogenase